MKKEDDFQDRIEAKGEFILSLDVEELLQKNERLENTYKALLDKNSQLEMSLEEAQKKMMKLITMDELE